MPYTITSTTPLAERSIGGVSVNIPQVFAAGHPLTEGEASQLNQVLAENISNNLRKRIELGVVTGEGEAQTSTPHTSETAQKLVDDFMSSYDMGVRRGGSGEARVTDPVEREAKAIAREKAKAYVKSQGLKPSDVDIGALTSKIFDANRDLLMAEGKKIVAAKAKAATKGDELDFGGIDLGAMKAAPAEAATA